jgi:hypothetical protein
MPTFDLLVHHIFLCWGSVLNQTLQDPRCVMGKSKLKRQAKNPDKHTEAIQNPQIKQAYCFPYCGLALSLRAMILHDTWITTTTGSFYANSHFFGVVVLKKKFLIKIFLVKQHVKVFFLWCGSNSSTWTVTLKTWLFTNSGSFYKNFNFSGSVVLKNIYKDFFDLHTCKNCLPYWGPFWPPVDHDCNKLEY